jgi:hypothetical protein
MTSSNRSLTSSRLQPGRSFPYSWSCDGEPWGSIQVQVEPSAVILSFRACLLESTEWKSVWQRVPVVWTPCHFGGGRPWFRCTAAADGRYCGRRVAKLYFGGSAVFACRQCFGLAYASQRESLPHRGIARARKIRMRLGGGPNLLDSFPAKPKRMHRRTYDKLRHLHDLAGARCGLT